MTKCEVCGFFWKEDYEKYAGCHYFGPSGWAPCDEDNWEPADDPEVWKEKA